MLRTLSAPVLELKPGVTQLRHLSKKIELGSFDFGKIPVKQVDPYSLKVYRFVPRFSTVSATEYMEKYKETQGNALPFGSRHALPEIYTDQSRTAHADDMFLGMKYAESGKLQRYLLKIIPSRDLHLVVRELAAPYCLAILGEGDHALKTTVAKVDKTNPNSDLVLCRRYVEGRDARIWLDNPEKFDHIPTSTLVRISAIVDTVFGNSDHRNPGNVIYAENSSLTQKTVIPIDYERDFANKQTMAIMNDQVIMFNKRYYESTGIQRDNAPIWKEGEPIIGSLSWRESQSEIFGSPQKFFEYQAELGLYRGPHPNPFIALLGSRFTSKQYKEFMSIPIPRKTIDTVILKEKELLSCLRSLGVYTNEEIQLQQTCIQETIKNWKTVLNRGDVVTFGMNVTGVFSRNYLS